MSSKIIRIVSVAACTACVAALTACGSGPGKAKVVTITVPPSNPPAASGNSTDSAASAPSSVRTPRPAATKLPGTCDSLLPDYQVTQALGGTQLEGDDQFVVGEPQRNIGRVAYINCRYGVTGTGDSAVAKVEIGVSLYSTPAQAADRIRSTVQDYTAHGATSADAVVGSTGGTLLTGGTGDGYDQPLLVTSADRRTVAVSVNESVASGSEVSAGARTLATLALRVTAG